MISNSNIQHHIECALDVGRTTPRSATDTIDLITEIHALNLDEVRIRLKGDKVILEGALRLLSTIHTEGNGYINGGRSLRATHRTRGIYDSHTIKGLAIEIISQIIPILIDHQTISVVQCNSSGTPVISHEVQCLINNLIRIQSLSIYLSGSILSKILIGASATLLTLNIVASKRILINQTSTRRNLVKLNLVPTILRHKTLNDINTSTQNRQSLTILARSHAHISLGNMSQLTRLCRTSILRLQPLTQQRRSLALDIQSQLALNELKCVLLQRSVNEHIQVVPTTILRNMLNHITNCICIMLSHILHDSAEETALTLASAHITQIKQALHSIYRVLLICLLEHQNNVLIRTSTHSTTQCEHIIQVSASRLVS